MLAILFTIPGTSAQPDVLAAPGANAILTVKVTVKGEVEASQGKRDEVVKWSTQREFSTRLKMAAGEAESASAADPTAGLGDSGFAAMEDMQKQALACGEDQACLMRIATQMMNSQEVQQAQKAPDRYQVWSAMHGEAPLELSGSHQDKWHTFFYAAARETTDCTITGPMASTKAGLDARTLELLKETSKEGFENSTLAFKVEVDSVENTAALNIWSPLSIGFSEQKCIFDIGSVADTSYESTNLAMIPADSLTLPIVVPGTLGGNSGNASGSASFEISHKLENLRAGYAVDVKAPLKLEVSWELKKN
jgi:hypothetical protein